ncbi:hypothetical protein EDD86DRAFT_195822 [Gorgonomyces haynaldii]|nr:hypothetical protein EDD86DRAFT_195822 [Gorgonomyces haynaldii]
MQTTPAHPLPEHEWSSGLFDCFGDLSTCLMAFICPCYVYAKNKQVLNGTGTIAPDCLLYCGGMEFGCCGVNACIGAQTRHDIRKQRNIGGSQAQDCLTSWCCYSCALTQEKHEIEEIKRK